MPAYTTLNCASLPELHGASRRGLAAHGDTSSMGSFQNSYSNDLRSHVLDTVRLYAKTQSGLRRVICDLSNVPYADVAGARMLRRMHEEFVARGVDFKIVEAHGPVREVLRAEGIEELVGSITRFASLADVFASEKPAD